jgi:hypothetical protein
MKPNTLKLHLYEVEVHGYTYHVLKLRPSEKVQLSNNYFHETWHLLAGVGGAEILAKLLWGLAYQKKPGTLLMLDTPHLTPTPFEADAPLPVIIALEGLARMDDDLLRALRRKLSHIKAPTATVKWQTFSLEGSEDLYKQSRPHDQEQEGLWRQEKMSLRGGMICYTAPSLILRLQALSVRHLGKRLYFGSNYTYLAHGDWRPREHPNGEVQVFGDFEDQVSAAITARSQVLTQPAAKIVDDVVRERVWAKAYKLTKARKAARKGRFRGEPETPSML